MIMSGPPMVFFIVTQKRLIFKPLMPHIIPQNEGFFEMRICTFEQEITKKVGIKVHCSRLRKALTRCLFYLHQLSHHP